MKLRYKFSHRSDDGRFYYWFSQRLPNDSRCEMVTCPVDWFWGR